MEVKGVGVGEEEKGNFVAIMNTTRKCAGDGFIYPRESPIEVGSCN